MPRRRTTVRFILVGLFLLAGYVAFESYRLSRTDPVVATDHLAAIRTRAIAMAGVDPDAGHDAWNAMIRAFDVQDEVDAEIIEQAQASGQPSRGTWDVGLLDYNIVLSNPTIMEAAERELRALALFEERGGGEALAAFARASTALRPVDAGGPDRATADPLEEIFRPELARARSLASMLGARMRVAQVDGDPALVAASFDQSLALARAMSYEPGVIGHLVGQGIRARAIEELDHELAEHDVGEALCRRLLDSLDRRKLAPAELAIETERALFHDMVQRRFTDDGDGNGRLAEDNLLAAAVARFLGPRRAKVLAVADTYFDHYVDTARLPVAQRAAQGFDRAAFIGDLGFAPSHRFVRNLLPDLDRAIAQIDISRSQIGSARLMLAIEIHRTRHDAPPERLAELAPAILSDIPNDPIHGGPFGYRRTADEGDEGEFVLYSFGVDGSDDGGTPSPKGAWNAYSTDGAGYDVVINAPRSVWPAE